MPDVAGTASPFTNAPSSLSQSTEILKQWGKETGPLKKIKQTFIQRSQGISELQPIKASLLEAGLGS